MSGNAMERGALGGEVRSRAQRIRRFLDIVYPSFINIYCKCGIMLILKGGRVVVLVLLYCHSSTPHSSVFLL